MFSLASHLGNNSISSKRSSIIKHIRLTTSEKLDIFQEFGNRLIKFEEEYSDIPSHIFVHVNILKIVNKK